MNPRCEVIEVFDPAVVCTISPASGEIVKASILTMKKCLVICPTKAAQALIQKQLIAWVMKTKASIVMEGRPEKPKTLKDYEQNKRSTPTKSGGASPAIQPTASPAANSADSGTSPSSTAQPAASGTAALALFGSNIC